MWKNFFFFSKSQITGIFVLISLIVIVITANVVLPLLDRYEPKTDPAFEAELKEFKKSLESSVPHSHYAFHSAPKYSIPMIHLLAFDPNTADWASLLSLGLKPWMIKNILKYRSKGGYYRQAADFAKVYGLSAEQFQVLQPYIRIENHSNQKADSLKKMHYQPSHKDEIPVVVELNSADSAQLVKVKGIGAFYAKRILGYRRVLGGYVSVSQLKEVYGMTDDNYERLRVYCKVDASAVKRICVNSWSLERMSAHPYLRFYKARAIIELRKKGKINDQSALLASKEFDKTSLEHLLPYLSFE